MWWLFSLYIVLTFTLTATLAFALGDVVIVMLMACCVGEVATSSRQLWSFARDHGIAYWEWSGVTNVSCGPSEGFITDYAQVPQGLSISIRSVIVSAVVTALLSCVNLGSATALNAINSLGSAVVLSSYVITIACLV